MILAARRSPVALSALALLALTGCIETIEGAVPPLGETPTIAVGQDLGADASDLSQLEVGIFIDPDGCHHWMADDGLEGYMDLRRDPLTGLPVCTDIAPPGSVVGDISAAPGINDYVPVR